MRPKNQKGTSLLCPSSCWQDSLHHLSLLKFAILIYWNQRRESNMLNAHPNHNVQQRKFTHSLQRRATWIKQRITWLFSSDCIANVFWHTQQKRAPYHEIRPCTEVWIQKITVNRQEDEVFNILTKHDPEFQQKLSTSLTFKIQSNFSVQNRSHSSPFLSINPNSFTFVQFMYDILNYCDTAQASLLICWVVVI